MSSPPKARRRKIILLALGGLLLLGVSAVLLLYAVGLDPYARRYVERLAEDALRVPIRIERAQIKLGGRSALSGISIVNPPGYRESEACHIDRLDGYLESLSVFRSRLEMRDLVVVHPVFTVDYRDGRSNFAVLISNLTGDPVDPLAAPPTVDAQTFRISRLRVVDGVVRFRSDAASGGFVSALLPDLELENFGTAPGVEPTLNTALALALEAIAGSVMTVEDPAIPADLRNSFGKELRGLSKPRKSSR